MTTKKPIVLQVWVAVLGDCRDNDRIIGVEAESREAAMRKLSEMGYGRLIDQDDILPCLMVGDTPEARTALAGLQTEVGP